MFHNHKVVVVMPAYNAARTLVRTYRDIPPGVVDHVILVDDILTTGSTAGACAACLCEGGAGTVGVLSVARPT